MLAACASATTTPLPPAPTQITPAPQGAASAFLEAWTRGDYAGMYSLLSPLSQDAVSQADFTARYAEVNTIANVTEVQTRLLNSAKSGGKALVRYEVTLRSSLFGALIREIDMPLAYEQERWGVRWTDGLILPELEGGGTLTVQAEFPARANIYDRNGLGLAVQGEAVSIDIVPGQMTDEGAVLNTLSPLLGQSPETLQAKYANALPNWRVHIGNASAADVQASFNTLSALPGVLLTTSNTRFYPFGGVAAHVTGYMRAISPEQLADYQAQGYTGDERVGVAGIEAWGERYLAGSRFGTLNVTGADGVTRALAESQPQPAQAVFTTLDRPLQQAAQQVLAGFRGSIVILNPATGEVLAMASNPTFDPNLFDPTISNASSEQLEAVLNNSAQPLLNRATQGAYPPGSIFKITMMGAAMLSGLYTRDTIVDCQSVWNGLGPNALKYNWTYARNIKPPGKINLVQALATSCNPYFYTIGLDLYNYNPDFIAQTARLFGFGVATRIEQVPETPGLMPDTLWKQQTYNEEWRPGDSVNMGIGQGFVLVTPLQVAQEIAAIRNDGTLYRPQLVLKAAPPGGEPTFTLTPQINGKLPVSAEQLAVIQEGMLAVTSDRSGTARSVFLGLGVPVAGKTGTAEDPNGGLPHAWFAGYTEANRADKPDIAMVVMLENIGEGSEYAAPIFRRMAEIYFNGKATTLLPWESGFGSLATPTP
ncbi:MAG: penicillin-binding transpeptidase domain-containing protein [Anaerolineales bacterium]